MHEEAISAAEKAAKDQGVSVRWEKIYSIAPTIFDEGLKELCRQAVEEETGEGTIMYSGPLHDAVEMARVVPTIMMFAMSEKGLSRCKEENTSDEALETAIRSFMRLVDKVVK